MDEDALERDLSGLMLSTIIFRGSTAVADLDVLELSCKHVAVYITTIIGLGKSEDESLEAMPNVIKVDKAYYPEKPGYGVSQTVADGRRAAEVIHKMINQ